MFDTHCHLNLDPLSSHILDVISDARDVSVSHFLVPATSIKNSIVAADIASDFENVYAACGIHPEEEDEEASIDKNMLALEEILDDDKVIAVGEVGLDYYKFKAPPRVQKLYLKAQIDLCKKYQKGLILHSRQATDDLVEILGNNWSECLRGRTVFHCCPAEEKLLKFATKHGIYIGVDGDLTYDAVKQKFIKRVPIEMLVLETDSPFLAPEPVRKFPNEPKNIGFIAAKLSEIKNISKDSAIDKTTANALSLFGI